MAPIKRFTLIDKHGQHLVFVNFEKRESFVLDTTNNVDGYIVGYEIKMPNA